MLEAALKYHQLGFRVIPTGDNKRPVGGEWAHYREGQTEQQVRTLFSNPGIKGIAVLTGVDGLECIDIDTKYDVKGNLFSRYLKYIEKFESVKVHDLLVQATPSGGWHFFFKCEYNDGNKKLARRAGTHQELFKANTEQEEKESKAKKDNPDIKFKRYTRLEQIPKVLIETRGVGGYVLVYPSPGYELQEGKTFAHLPTITMEERAVLMNSAIALNELDDEKSISHVDRKVKREIDGVKKKYGNPDMVTCWDAYNDSDEVLSCLRDYGWKEITRMETSDRIYLTRPGKDFGLSADFHKEKRLFKCWSTSTIFEDQKAYTPFSVFALMEHNGDTSAAAKELYKLGFGERFVKQDGQVVDISKPKNKNTVYKFDYGNPPLMNPHTLSVWIDGKEYPIAGEGNMVCFVGKAKVGKTTVIACPIASALDGASRKMGFVLDLKGKEIDFIDTEQPVNNFYKTQKFIHTLAKKAKNVGSYNAYSLREKTVKERIEWIEKHLAGRKNLGLLVIDGAVDLCEDFNEVGASTRTVQHMMRWTEQTGAMLFTALHLTKGNGYMKGHLGSILAAKCDSTMDIERDSDTNVGKVKCRLSRGFDVFPPFEFKQMEDRIPILMNSGFDELGRPVNFFERNSLSTRFSGNELDEESDGDECDNFMQAVENGSWAGIEKPQYDTEPARMNDDPDIPF